MPEPLPANEWAPRGIEELEPNADVVVRSDQNMCVTAGPGAGKTELLAQRASFLLETGACAPPRRILAISFKRDAAKNLRDRVVHRSGQRLARRLDSFTFDAFSKGMLDQFLEALPPSLRPSPDYEPLVGRIRDAEMETFLRRMTPPTHLGTRRDLRQFAFYSFLDREVPRASLRDEPTTLRDWTAKEFWRTLLHDDHPSNLTFRMITRLAGELILRDPRLRRAYRSTYSHVFLDEFQDTTELQYWLTRVLFQNVPSVLTAVGDPRQRIMGWAGALRSAFVDFQKHFGAKHTELHRNHRASVEIAPVVRFLADQLGGAVRDEVDALLPGSGPPAESCAAHLFPDEDDEAEWIAAEIDDLLEDGVAPRDVSILVRMKAREYGERVITKLRERGRSARVEDQLQDLLTEPAVAACMLGLRALASRRPRDSWAAFRELVVDHLTTAVDDDGERARLERDLEAARRSLRAAYPSAPVDASSVRSLLGTFIEPFVAAIRARHGQYRRGSLFATSLEQLAEAVAAATSGSGSWDSTLDEVEGLTAVPILTIHKSKGLEYHAVFFVGLEDGAFWNFRRNPDEESNAFFVALARAKERVSFTFSENRTRRGRREVQTTTHVSALYDLMRAAGVEMVQHNPLN